MISNTAIHWLHLHASPTEVCARVSSPHPALWFHIQDTHIAQLSASAQVAPVRQALPDVKVLVPKAFSRFEYSGQVLLFLSIHYNFPLLDVNFSFVYHSLLYTSYWKFILL